MPGLGSCFFGWPRVVPVWRSGRRQQACSFFGDAVSFRSGAAPVFVIVAAKDWTAAVAEMAGGVMRARSSLQWRCAIPCGRDCAQPIREKWLEVSRHCPLSFTFSPCTMYIRLFDVASCSLGRRCCSRSSLWWGRVRRSRFCWATLTHGGWGGSKPQHFTLVSKLPGH